MQDTPWRPAAALTGRPRVGLAVGAVSALTLFVPAEAYVLSVAVTSPPPVALGAAVAAAVGQTLGKVVIFTSTRTAGRSRWLGRLRERHAVRRSAPRRARHESGRLRSWLSRVNARGMAMLAGPAGPGVVLVSGVVGLPPLLAVAFVAGASAMSLRAFAASRLVGRTVRFAVLAVAPDLFPLG